MAYKLVKHRKVRGHTRHLEVLVNAEIEPDYLTAVTEYEEAMVAYEAAMALYQEELAAWRAEPIGPRPVAPVMPEAPNDLRIYESFDWGMDVPLASVRRETRLLLDAKYKVSEEVLPGEDDEF